MTTLLVATPWMACGGKAVVDGGVGGAGGTNPSNSSSSTGPSSSSGGACSCQTACNYLESCGFFGPECLTICNQGTDPEFIACVCNSQGSCAAISNCGIGSTGTSVAVSSSGAGGGGPLTQQCVNCVQNQLDNGFCAMEIDACLNNPQCEQLIDCGGNCGFTPGCIAQCEGTYPGGVQPSHAFMGCALCGACYPSCASSYAAQYYCDTF